MFTLPQQPQTIGETLDTGFKLYFKVFKHVILLSSIMYAIILVFTVFFSPQVNSDGTLAAAETTSLVISYLVLVLASIILTTAMIHRIFQFTEGRPEQLSDSLKAGIKLFFPMFFAMLLFFLIIMLGFVLLIIPGIALMIYLMLFGIVLVVESRGPIDSLQRSMDLVKQNWWRSMLVITVVMVVYGILSSVLVLGLSLSIAFYPPDDVLDYVFYYNIFSSIIGAIFLPLTYSMSFTLYNDLKLRREGGDIEARLNEME